MSGRTFDFSILMERALQPAPRIISHQDRNEMSPTYGYFGRRYWAWKTSPMPDASNQYALYYLALLWSLREDRNPYFQTRRTLEWIHAGLSRWIQLQHPDGSFDQVFPHEHSVGVTAYTLHAVLETQRILHDELEASLREKLGGAIEKAGAFLLENDEGYGIISNHLALFAVTLHELWNLTGKRTFRDKCRQLIQKILHHMSPEGWFMEYDGSDPGYMTQALYYLALLQRSGYDELSAPLRVSICEYLPYFIHPDGSTGGHYGSRNCEMFYPGGFALMSPQYPEAREVLSCMCRGIGSGKTPVPDALDFPNAIRLACNYLVAWDFLNRHPATREGLRTYKLPHDRPPTWKEFPEAGMLVVGNTSYYAITGTKKGGVLKIFDAKTRRLLCDDLGYVAEYGNRFVTTQSHFETGHAREGNCITLEHPLSVVRLQKMTPGKYWLLLWLSFFLFRIRWVREAFKKQLVALLITGKEKTTGFYRRTIRFEDDRILVSDEMEPPHDAPLRNVTSDLRFSSIHMASADYFDFSGLLYSDRKRVPVVNQRTVVASREYTFPAQK